MSEAGVKKLHGLLKRLRGARAAPASPPQMEGPPGSEPALNELVYSMMLWEAGSTPARGAFRRLREALVDYNELRVCTTDELVGIVGENYPRSRERGLRLKSILNDLFRRQQSLSLAPLQASPKREARAVLDALDGMPRFVSARLLLLHLGGHAVPCDDRLAALLADEGVLEKDPHSEAASTWLEHHIRSDDALEAHALLQAWADEHVPAKGKKGLDRVKNIKGVKKAAPSKPRGR